MIEHIRIKPDKCKACRRCEVACIAAHHNLSFKEAMKHRDEFVSRVQVVKAEGLKTSVRCHQCEDAPCCNVCPTNALKQDEDGRITMCEENCISCQMCVRACPYGTISMDTLKFQTVPDDETDLPATIPAPPDHEIAVRCDMCHAWRIENGKKITACMEVCPVRALYLVETDGSILEAPLPEKKAVAAKPKEESAQA